MEKNKFVDDQRSFTNMDVEGISKRYDLQSHKKRKKEPKDRVNLTQNEEKAIYRASLRAMIIPLMCAILGFILTFAIIWIWLFA